MSGCGPGTRATCSAVLFGAFEAYPPLGTTPGVRGGAELEAVRELMRNLQARVSLQTMGQKLPELGSFSTN
jgi:hypothetical protein